MSSNENMKKDLIDLYSELYKISISEWAVNIFSPNILSKLKYRPEEVQKLLEFTAAKREKESQKIKTEVADIKTKEQAISYLEDNLFIIFQPDIGEENKNNILKKTSLEELKYLYQIIFGVPLSGKQKKIDVIYKLKDFYSNEKRTTDLIKNLVKI